MDLILFGIQGAGKGTVAKALAEKYNMTIFETGAALRDIAKKDSELGKKVKKIIEAGNLVPNDIVMEIVEDFIHNLENEESGVIFDGVPRSTFQAESLNTLLKKLNRDFIAAELVLEPEIAMERLLKRVVIKDGKEVKRKDDTPEIIEKRFRIFKEETRPTIDSYQDLIKIDGRPDIETVREYTFKTLGEYLEN